MYPSDFSYINEVARLYHTNNYFTQYIPLHIPRRSLNKPKPIPDYLLIKDIQLGVAGQTFEADYIIILQANNSICNSNRVLYLLVLVQYRQYKLAILINTYYSTLYLFITYNL